MIKNIDKIKKIKAIKDSKNYNTIEILSSLHTGYYIYF